MFIRHRGTLVRVHQLRLSKVNAQEEDKSSLPSVSENCTENQNRINTDVLDSSENEQRINGEERNPVST